MNTPDIFKHRALLAFLWLAFFSMQATAAIDNGGLMDNVLSRYSAAASTWGAVVTSRATWLFWTLVVISMVWTFGMMALRKADVGEFYAEFVRFTIFNGFFWWLLTNGPGFATSIMTSLRQIASEASGMPTTLAPSGIVDIGFDLFFKVLDQSSVWKPMDSACGLVLSGIVLVVFALISVNMLLLLISGWILAYAGIFFLGFGGSRWTSEMAIGYFKAVLNIAAQLFTMVLLIGIGKSFVDVYYTNMSTGMMNLKELGVMLVVAVILLALVKTVPGLIGGLAGGNTGSLGQGFGAGAAVGAAAMAGAAIATAGAALAAGAASAGGGVQALMAAYSKASAAESAGGGAGSLLAAAGGGGSADGGGSSLAAAMGDSGASSSSAGSSGTDSGGGGSSSASTGADSGSSAGSSSASPGGGAGAPGSPAGEGSPGEVKRGGKMAAAGAMAARAGKVAAGTAANLAVGSWDVVKGKAADLKAGALERIGETTGGKIAAAIEARGAMGKAAKFDDDSLSAGADDKAVDAAAEIAQFRDRGSKA